MHRSLPSSATSALRGTAATLAAVFSRRRVRYTAAAVVVAVAAGAVAVANAALLEVAGSPQNQVGELSAKLNLRPPRIAIATTTEASATTTTAAPVPVPAPPTGIRPAASDRDDHGVTGNVLPSGPRHDGGHRDD